MMPLDEKDLQLLAEVLPNVSAQLRSSMANVFAAANRLAPAEAREADPMLDKNAAILTMSCHQMLRLVGNLSAASELVQGGRFRLCNDDIVGFCHALCERAEPLFALRGVALRFSASSLAFRTGEPLIAIPLERFFFRCISMRYGGTWKFCLFFAGGSEYHQERTGGAEAVP